MKHLIFILLLLPVFSPIYGQHFEMNATAFGNTISVFLKPVGGNVTAGFSDIEFFLRNGTAQGNPDFEHATITVNTTAFPSVLMPFNGTNAQGTETGYNNYWFGTSYLPTQVNTYTSGQPYLLCTISLASPASDFHLELCHNDPGYIPHYLAIINQLGVDLFHPSGNKFYGDGAVICSPVNCPASTSGANHILPIATAPMPVELLSFEAGPMGAHRVLLRWETLETEAVFFQIERKSQGDWEEISDKIEATHTQSYQFVDQNAPEELVYYRLKIMDASGRLEYSPWRSVDFRSSAAWLIYPNPVADVLHIQSETADEFSFQLTLESAEGRIVYASTITFNAQKTATLSLSGLLPSGWYQLMIADEEGHIMTRKGVVISQK